MGVIFRKQTGLAAGSISGCAREQPIGASSANGSIRPTSDLRGGSAYGGGRERFSGSSVSYFTPRSLKPDYARLGYHACAIQNSSQTRVSDVTNIFIGGLSAGSVKEVLCLFG